ncbi:MAG: T9SS type B sorting domain-containing protein, partial [Sphingobacteriales bacterium]
QNLQLNSCDYTDGFAFLLKEAGTNNPYQNLAVIPNTNIPVMVTTVRGEGTCPSANVAYFGGYNGEEHPTNYNGQTVVLTAHANVVAGVTYHIKLVVADQGDSLFDSAIFFEGGSFSAVADLDADRLLATGNPICDGETFTVNATAPGAGGYQWAKDGTPIIGATNATYTIAEPGTYTVNVQFTGTCVAEGKIRAEYAPALPTGTYTLLQCDDNGDGLTLYTTQSIGEAVTATTTDAIEILGYYKSLANANAGTSPINTTVPFSNTTANQQVFVKIKNQYGCEGIATVILSTPVTAFSSITPLVVCDTDGTDDGLFNFDLTPTRANLLAALPAGLTIDFYTSYNAALAQENPLAELLFTNTQPGGQVIYGRVNNATACFGIAQIPLIVNYFGTLMPETLYLCDEVPLPITAPAGMATYTWDTTPPLGARSITVGEPGAYTVTLTTTDGCEGTKTYTVLPSGAVKAVEYTINDFMGGSNSVSISPKGAGHYEFSLDGIRYQENPMFTNLAAGEYNIHIRDINGCIPDFTDVVYILDYPKFFTPNEDGTNDTWKIAHLKTRPELTVNIYDRYGKPIVSFKGNTGWDGNLNGRHLPANDYWFSILLENGREVKGHFSLIR